MNVYHCQRCPLAFQVGYNVFWDLTGGWAWYVCLHCGTMHRIDHLKNGLDQLYALDGPIRAMTEEIFTMPDQEEIRQLRLWIDLESWQLIKSLPAGTTAIGEKYILPKRIEAVALDQISCAHCGQLGGLKGGIEERFGEICPLCQGPLEMYYSITS